MLLCANRKIVLCTRNFHTICLCLLRSLYILFVWAFNQPPTCISKLGGFYLSVIEEKYWLYLVLTTRHQHETLQVTIVRYLPCRESSYVRFTFFRELRIKFNYKSEASQCWPQDFCLKMNDLKKILLNVLLSCDLY